MDGKYVALSDIHLLMQNPVCRLDDLTEVQWDKLGFAFDFAVEHEADILVAGDFHVKSNDYSLLNKLIVFLKKYYSLGIRVFAVYGQHDLKYRNPDDTNLQIIINSEYIQLLGDEPHVVGGHNPHRIYGMSWKGSIPKPSVNAFSNVLVIHDSISPVKLYPGDDSTDAMKFLTDHPEFDLIICGDIHRTFYEEDRGRIIINPGPLLRREADEYNMIHKPGFFYLDINKKETNFIQVPHEPSERIISREHIEKKNKKQQTAARADTSQFLSELRARTSGNTIRDIRDRIKLRIEKPDGSTQQPVLDVLEHLLNGRKIEQYIEERK